MALEIANCLFVIAMKIYEIVKKVRSNRRRCQRLADRIRCLVSPLEGLLTEVSVEV